MTTFANINVGSAPNDGTGDSLRASFTKVNENFQLVAGVIPAVGTGNIVANVTSYGTSQFTILTSGSLLISTGITANSVSASTIGNAGASIVGNITTAAQPNITSLGTLSNLTVSGNITGNVISSIIKSATIGNTGASLVGNIATAAQPNITSLGNLTGLTMAYGSNVGNTAFNLIGVSNIIRNMANNLGSNLAANITVEMAPYFSGGSEAFRFYTANSNVAISTYANINGGFEKMYAIKNVTAGNIFVTLPTVNNNKGTNLIPIASNVTATFNFFAFDTTSANVVVRIVNN